MCKDYQKDFEAGLYTKVRPNRFDSISEKKVCLILNRILKDYGLEKMMQICHAAETGGKSRQKIIKILERRY